MIGRIIEELTDLLFPRRCPVCQDAVDEPGALICTSCSRKLKLIREPYCMKCGKPLFDEEQEMCEDCIAGTHDFTRGRALFLYDEIMKKSIYNFKYCSRREYGTFYGKMIHLYLGDMLKKWKTDAIIPVPLSKERYEKRGYNQAELIARALSLETNIPVYDRILIREKNTIPQKNLTIEERKNNLKNAFKLCVNDVKLKSIVLIDDIYTTGSTIDSCAQCFKKMGVRDIYFIVLCIGR